MINEITSSHTEHMSTFYKAVQAESIQDSLSSF